MKHMPYIRIVPGSAVAVLMIHGIVGTPRHFDALVPLIPESWSVYNILLDGHGKDVKDFAATSMKKWHTQVDRQMEEILLQHQQVLLVAHSMGCLFSIRQAIRHKDRVMGLFLLNVPFAPQYPPSTMIATMTAAFGKAKPGTAAGNVTVACGTRLSPRLWEYIGWAPRFVELLTEIRQVRQLLPQLQVQTRTFQSQKDELVRLRSCKYLEGHPYIQNTILPNSGHFVYAPEDLQLLQDALRQSLEAHTADGGSLR